MFSVMSTPQRNGIKLVYINAISWFDFFTLSSSRRKLGLLHQNLIFTNFPWISVNLDKIRCALFQVVNYSKSLSLRDSVRLGCDIHTVHITCKKIYSIITLVRQKKARFDSKMHGSREKSPVRQKNARFDRKMPSPECISWHCHYQTSPPPPSSEKYFFPIFF